MSEILNKILQQGYVDELPDCEQCNIDKKGQKEKQAGYPFLILSYGKMVCGMCAVKMAQGKICSICNSRNHWLSNFCMNCGVKFNG